MIKSVLRRFPFYPELRRVRWAFHYRKTFSYLWHRWAVGPRIRWVGHEIDRMPGTAEYSIHVLCSHRDLTMLLWSLASFYRVTSPVGALYIHEDGSFTKRDFATIVRLLPRARVIGFRTADERYKTWLSGYSHLIALRKATDRYIFSLKLIDPFFVSSAKARLIFDTDVLWFSPPHELVKCMRDGTPLMLKGRAPMEYTFENGEDLPRVIILANSGIVHYAKAHFRLSALEAFALRNGPRNPSRVIEQAAYAYVLQPRLSFLNQDAYHIKGPVGPRTVAKHYTGPRREMFWFEGVQLLKNRLL